MHLCALTLHHFRLYEQAHFSFSPGLNTIRGPNGHGKTSLLEAIYFLMTGSSFRTAQPSEMIQHGAAYFFIQAQFVKHGIDQHLRVYYSSKERKLTCNATSYSSYTNLLGVLPGTVIHPDDVDLIKGSPGGRRQLLDMQLSQTDPLYVHHLTRYERALRQRNHLLRTKTSIAIESWEYEMANSAAYIVQQRTYAIQKMQGSALDIYATISGHKEILGLGYKAHGAGDCSVDHLDTLREIFRDQYRRHRIREMDVGFTLSGPHKDDMTISLGGKEARLYGSEGQQRSCAIALRLAEWQRLRATTEVSPLMLVDDLAMSLDARRKERLESHLAQLGQVFVTIAD